MTVAETLRAATVRLRAGGIDSAPRDARLLLAEAIGCPPDRLTLLAHEALDAAATDTFDAMLASRLERRPVSQILGRRLFWNRSFAVTSDVLDPRPETETLIGAALAGPAPASILDLGTGSGVILLTLLAEWPDARGIGTDLSAPALAVAAGNAQELGLAARARFLRADWFAGITGHFDLVVCNPPYIAAAEVERLSPEVRDWEPRAALTAGPTGLEAYHRIAARLGSVLAPGGRALFEFGAGQDADVGAIFQEQGFTVAGFHEDLDGRKRVIEII